MRLVCSLTIGCSAFLLFELQPIMAKALLPVFGGSAGVWVTCILFFQVMLLAGYFYSYAVTRWLSRQVQCSLHATLLIVSVATLSLRHGVRPNGGNPAMAILITLLSSVGLPYFLLSTTSPLVQSWFAASSGQALPYRLFALSNAASMVALLSYPVLIEPLMTESSQLNWWSVGYRVFALLAGATAIFHWRQPLLEAIGSKAREVRKPFLWIGLAACASTLWMAVANHLSREVAPVPFLWILPLSVYLLSFILCFEGDGWYRPALFRWLLPVSWIAVVWRLDDLGPAGIAWELTIFALGLFVWCMFCHGEIARTRPETPGSLSGFYLTIAFGGALGAAFVGVAAPNFFSTYLELPIGIAISVLLALRLLFGIKSPSRLARLGAVAVVAFWFATHFESLLTHEFHVRNFYGALLVSDEGADASAVRTLYDGRTLHGAEFLASDRLREATAYYGPESGAGRVLLSTKMTNRRVGLVGLGVGTLAAYGRPGDVFRFYEINPAVITIASRDFHYLGTSDAKIEVVEGDGRLSLAREPANSFDVLVLDAFADDSIPVHLLTTEAFAMYWRLLRSDGVLAIHLTNRYLDIAPVVEAVAADLNKYPVTIHSGADPVQRTLAADWVLVAGREDLLREFGMPGRTARNARLWTDDYSNLFQVLR